MAQVKRSDFDIGGHAAPQRDAADHAYDAGGHIAQLQADLARRLAGGGADELRPAEPPAERIIRFLSVAGGYLALSAGYGAAALAIAYVI